MTNPARKPENLRAAREAARLSRRALADLVGSTPHYVWHCEMPPYDGPDEVAERMWAVLEGATTTQGNPTPAQRGQPRGQSGVRWGCPRCGHMEETPIPALEVQHKCPKANNRSIQLRQLD